MKHKRFGLVVVLISLPLLSTVAFANSSWGWLTDDPRIMLPWAISGTLAVEVFAVCFFNRFRLGDIMLPSAVIALGNLLSFLTPYLIIGIMPVIFEEDPGFFARIEYEVSRHPFYIVGIAFLLFTLVVEIPVVYFSLRKRVKNRRALLLCIAISNVFTTGAVALIERITYKGSW